LHIALTESLPAGGHNFRWTIEDDLEKLRLTAPVHLTEIKTKGHPGSVMTAIQLCFSNGIESPMFDTNNPKANA